MLLRVEDVKEVTPDNLGDVLDLAHWLDRHAQFALYEFDDDDPMHPSRQDLLYLKGLLKAAGHEFVPVRGLTIHLTPRP